MAMKMIPRISKEKSTFHIFLQLEFDDAELLERKPEEEFAGEGQLIASS